jgi:hypothetical protein
MRTIGLKEKKKRKKEKLNGKVSVDLPRARRVPARDFLFIIFGFHFSSLLEGQA